MADEAQGRQETGDQVTPLAPPRLQQAQDALLAAAREVMAVEDVTLGERNSPIRLRGQLTMPAAEAFAWLRPRFEAAGHTPLLRREGDQDVILALPTVFQKPTRSFPTAAVALFALTVISVFLTGMGQADGLYLPPVQVALVQITGNASLTPYPELLPSPAVWRAALITGLQYTLALLGILGAHEMGHYLVARYHKVHTSPPFFIPMPFNILGTLGAVIAMREPSPNRRIQFDIGVAGPLAGLIIALPVMAAGLLMSQVGTSAEFLADLPPVVREQTVVFHEGQSLAYLAMKFLIFGRILPADGLDVWVHPVAFAAWAGFLVTALNLLPIGQLDGGHVLYGLFGDRARRARLPVLIALGVLGALGSLREALIGLPPGEAAGLLGLLSPLAALPIPGWSGWWIWLAMGVLLLRGHAPVLDEITTLDGRRRALGIAMLVIFILIFTPTPIQISPLS